MKKERVDKLIVQQGLTDSREQARRLVMAGQIYDQNNQRYDKAGEKIPADRELHIKGKVMPYVSRGGLKLEKAIKTFEIDMTDQILLDIGSSTGGFTDAALQFGAKMSYALDVGYNQLAYSLRIDPRVEVMERQNFRYSTSADFTRGVPTVASIDVSFISLRLILPPLVDILAEDGIVLMLVKPQFEAGRERIGKNGIVKERQTHIDVVTEVLQFASSIGYQVEDLTFSPITGGEGNIEFLAKLSNKKVLNNRSWEAIDITAVVDEAHHTF